MPSCEPNTKFSEKDIPDLTGYVIIVTGGNSGIGYETAYHLALAGARVYISSRSQARVDEAIKAMGERAGRQLDLRFLQVDLQDLRSVRKAAEGFGERDERLDVLINNAGVSLRASFFQWPCCRVLEGRPMPRRD